MKTLGTHNYFVYILTNKNRTVLYIGVTNNLEIRLSQHQNLNDEQNHFTAKYKCFYLMYYEHFQDIEEAVKREKQLKGWTRKKKEALIDNFNPNWDFLNQKIN